MRFLILVAAALFALAASAQEAVYPAPIEGDFVVEDFSFASGETLDELRLHYRTIGELRRDDRGRATNAVLIMHGTTGSGASLLSEHFADYLFRKGGLLDASKYFIILPDAIGHGQSSKPSDGLRMRFPKYGYDDMVRAQHLLVTEALGVDRLRLVMGTSMGGMHSWVWAYQHPGMMDAVMPLASLPVEIAGRNRMLRKMIVDAVKDDPDWRGGDYEEKPMRGLRAALSPLIVMVSSPLQYQKQAPTREEAEAMLEGIIERYAAAMDPNDLIYAFEASRDYNPAPHLAKIRAPLIAINFADDQVNPPELGLLEREIDKVKNGRAVVMPITNDTVGHGTHSRPAVWGELLRLLLEESAR